MRTLSAIFVRCLMSAICLSVVCLSVVGVAQAEDKGSAVYYVVENDDLFREAIEKHGAMLTAAGPDNGGKEGAAVDFDREYLVKIPAGAEDKVIRAYSEDLMRAMIAEGAKVSPKTRVVDKRLHGFTVKYTCPGAVGVVHVHIEPRPAVEEHLIYVYCYEHAAAARR